MRLPRLILSLGPASAALVGGLALAGCASDLPTHQIAHARDSIVRAQEDGADKLAVEPLAMAQDKLAKAKAASDKGDYVTARRLAEQAEVDAEYASAAARAVQAEKTAADVQDPQSLQHRQTRTFR